MTQDELRAWDMYAAAALAGLLAVEEICSNDYAKDAAGHADSLIVERRKRRTPRAAVRAVKERV